MKYPKVILSLGLPRSGSTWVYNVVQNILKLSNRPYSALFADTLDALPEDKGQDHIFLVKSHTAEAPLRELAMKNELPIVISLRDPRDALASAITFTNAKFDVLLDLICSSVEAISRCLDYSGSMVLRYEDNFTADIGTIERLAAALGVSNDQVLFERIQGDLRADVVRSEIERLVAAGHFGENPNSSKFDPVSQWHPGHIADGRIGKYRDMLTSDQIAAVHARLCHFMRSF